MGSSSERNWEARNRVPADKGVSMGSQPTGLSSQAEGTRQRPGALQELTDRGSLAELDHLAQTDAGSWE
jgi:hypothetical protein